MGEDEHPDGPAYVLGSLVLDPERTTSYVNVLDAIAPQTIDYPQAHELVGNADVSVHRGAVFGASAEGTTIAKYTLEVRRAFSTWR